MAERAVALLKQKLSIKSGSVRRTSDRSCRIESSRILEGRIELRLQDSKRIRSAGKHFRYRRSKFRSDRLEKSSKILFSSETWSIRQVIYTLETNVLTFSLSSSLSLISFTLSPSFSILFYSLHLSQSL